MTDIQVPIHGSYMEKGGISRMGMNDIQGGASEHLKNCCGLCTKVEFVLDHGHEKKKSDDKTLSSISQPTVKLSPIAMSCGLLSCSKIPETSETNELLYK